MPREEGEYAVALRVVEAAHRSNGARLLKDMLFEGVPPSWSRPTARKSCLNALFTGI